MVSCTFLAASLPDRHARCQNCCSHDDFLVDARGDRPRNADGR
jgi:hypothetical protein